jgi:hypothetical protein
LRDIFHPAHAAAGGKKLLHKSFRQLAAGWMTFKPLQRRIRRAAATSWAAVLRC